ncbi:MAG TPA: hypothetical protein VKT80_01125 [Chloroflexota bacterium]|nr:hypothetical protein [Chloroflexota bacterium]
MFLRLRLSAGAALLAAILALLLPGVALAHEKRTVGKYIFVVGFIDEPAIQGLLNGLDLTITDASGSPVEGAEKTLKVAIAFGGNSPKELPLSARFGLKGQYTAVVIPTKAGSYSYIFSGTVNGDAVNETFESGPGRFGDVVPPTTFEFPAASSATSDLTPQVQSATATAQAALQRATLLGGAGIAIGLAGLVFGVVALVTRGLPAPPATTGSTTVPIEDSH